MLDLFIFTLLLVLIPTIYIKRKAMAQLGKEIRAQLKTKYALWSEFQSGLSELKKEKNQLIVELKEIEELHAKETSATNIQ